MQAFKEALFKIVQDEIQSTIDHAKDHLGDYGNLDSFNPELKIEHYDNLLMAEFGSMWCYSGNEALIEQLKDTDYVEKVIEDTKESIITDIVNELDDLVPEIATLDDYLKYGRTLSTNFNLNDHLETLSKDIFELKKYITKLGDE